MWFPAPFFCYFIVQVQNVSSPLHNLICGLVHISEMVFPEYGVHFIAVNDGVDSIKGDSEFTAIRNVFNEMFAKDTSKKIKATWQSKERSGEHLCTIPPYGYMKDPEDKKARAFP